MWKTAILSFRECRFSGVELLRCSLRAHIDLLSFDEWVVTRYKEPQCSTQNGKSRGKQTPVLVRLVLGLHARTNPGSDAAPRAAPVNREAPGACRRISWISSRCKSRLLLTRPGNPRSSESIVKSFGVTLTRLPRNCAPALVFTEIAESRARFCAFCQSPRFV